MEASNLPTPEGQIMRTYVNTFSNVTTKVLTYSHLQSLTQGFGLGPPRAVPQPVFNRHQIDLRPVFGTATLPTGAPEASRRDKGGFWTVFGTETLPTSTSEPSPRGEGVIYRVFGTETLPTGASVASSGSHCELVHRIVAELGFVKFTWNEPLLIIK